MKKFAILSTLALAMAFSGCKKDSPATKSDLLTAGPWRCIALTANPAFKDKNGNQVTDVFATFAPCDKDGTIRFELPNTLSSDEGPTKCNPAYPQTSSDDTWEFNADQTAIIAQISGSKGTFTLLELTENRLSYSFVEPVLYGKAVLTQTFVRK